jgi:hypothetical protein
MGIFNDSYDVADIIMTRQEKGDEAAEKKKAEIKAKKAKKEQGSSE